MHTIMECTRSRTQMKMTCQFRIAFFRLGNCGSTRGRHTIDFVLMGSEVYNRQYRTTCMKTEPDKLEDGDRLSATVQYARNLLRLESIGTHNKATSPPRSTAPEEW